MILSQKKLDDLSRRLSDAIGKQLDDAARTAGLRPGPGQQRQGCHPQRRGIRRPGRRDPGPYHHSGQSLKTMRDSREPARGQPPGAGGDPGGEGPLEAENAPIRPRSRPSARTLHDGGGEKQAAIAEIESDPEYVRIQAELAALDLRSRPWASSGSRRPAGQGVAEAAGGAGKSSSADLETDEGWPPLADQVTRDS